MSSFSFPSKTFVVGEYAVLHAPVEALLLCHSPHFHSTFTPGPAKNPFHPMSPAGKWLAQNPAPGEITFSDPHQGAGGFGGSGAEFLSAWMATRFDSKIDRATLAWAAWESASAFPGSGADILVQAWGMNREDAFLTQVNLRRHTIKNKGPVRGGKLALFHTGKKFETHAQVLDFPLPLEELCQIAQRAADSKDFPSLAREIQLYGDALAGAGLLAPHSAEALNNLKGTAKVLASKGCGAMGADVLLVAHQGANLSSWAQANSLVPIGSFQV